MTNPFLLQRHRQYNTPEPLLYDLVRRATGRTPLRCEAISSGYDSEVYAIETEGSESAVVRIRRHGEVPFVQETWALEQARKAGVPVPEVLHLSLLPDSEAEVMVQRRVPGEALRRLLPRLAPKALQRLGRELGEALGRLHRIATGGFYRRQPDGNWDFPAWEGIASAHLRDRAAEIPRILPLGFTEEEGDQLLRMVRRSVEEFPCLSPVLCHGDIGLDHIFADTEGNLTGLIDFGEFQGGDPMTDIAPLCRDIPALDMRQLAEGYANPEVFDSRFARRRLLHEAGYLIGLLAYHHAIGDAQAARRAALSLRKTLNLWQIQSGAETR